MQPIIVWYFYWYKSVLKIQMIVFLWWSHSTLVSFVFWRNDSSGRVLVLSWLDDRRVDRVCGSPPEQAAFRLPFLPETQSLILLSRYIRTQLVLIMFNRLQLQCKNTVPSGFANTANKWNKVLCCVSFF